MERFRTEFDAPQRPNTEQGECDDTANQMCIGSLKSVSSFAELREVAGELTDADRDLIASLNLFDPPTDEELAVLGPDFVERIINQPLCPGDPVGDSMSNNDTEPDCPIADRP